MRSLVGPVSGTALAWLVCAPALAAQRAAPVAAQSVAAVSPPAVVLTLRDAVRLALGQSPDLLPARDGVTLAGIQQDVAESRFGLKITPTFRSGAFGYGLDQQTVGLSLSKQLPTGTQLSMLVDASHWRGSAMDLKDGGYTFGLTQPLLRGFGPAVTAERTAAHRGSERSSRRLSEARQQIVVNVAEVYFAIVRHQRLIAAGELALERARFLRTGSEARAKVGLATELDVLRADLLAAQSEAGLEEQREALETDLDQLKFLVGRPPESMLAIAGEDIGGDPFGLARFASRPVKELVSIALRTRPDMAESRDGIDDALRDQRVARWNLLPDVNVSLSYARRGFGAADSELANSLFGGWRAGVSTSYPLDQAVQHAALARADVGLRAAERDVIQTERRLALDVRRAHRAWVRTADSISIRRKAVDMADRQLRLARLRYERGIAGNFDVVDAEHNVLQMQAALIGAEIERELAGLRLLRAMGVLDPGVAGP